MLSISNYEFTAIIQSGTWVLNVKLNPTFLQKAVQGIFLKEDATERARIILRLASHRGLYANSNEILTSFTENFHFPFKHIVNLCALPVKLLKMA